MSLSVTPLKTRIFRSGESVSAFVIESIESQAGSLAHARECLHGRVLAITSKIVSLSESRECARTLSKSELIASEADRVLGTSKHGTPLTLKQGLLIPAAGIDESNSPTGNYILYPEHPWDSALRICRELRDILGDEKIGVLLTDSRTLPLRVGVTGVALSFSGFRGVRDDRGQRDLFGRELKLSQTAVADALAAAAVLEMGEGAEQRPLAIIASDTVAFQETLSPDTMRESVAISPEEDLFFELYRG